MGRSGQFVPPEIQQMVDSHVARQAANRERRMAEDEQFTKVRIIDKIEKLYFNSWIIRF